MSRYSKSITKTFTFEPTMAAAGQDWCIASIDVDAEIETTDEGEDWRIAALSVEGRRWIPGKHGVAGKLECIQITLPKTHPLYAAIFAEAEAQAPHAIADEMMNPQGAFSPYARNAAARDRAKEMAE